MGMTMTQKILAAHAGLDSVCAGQLIEADLDLVLGNDITSPVAIHEMEKMKTDGVFHKDKIALVLDHFVPNKDIKSAEHCKCVRYLYIWSTWSIFHRSRKYRHGSRNGNRKSMVQSTGGNQGRVDRSTI